MRATWMYSGLRSILAGMTGELTTPRPGTLRLYTNEVTPNASDDSTVYTECALPGYSPLPLRGFTWQQRFADGVVRIRRFAVEYTFTSYLGPQVQIFGSFCTLDATAPAMFYAHPFDEPFPVPLTGGPLVIDLQFTLRQLVDQL